MESTIIVIYLVCLAALAGMAVGIALVVAVYLSVVKSAFR